MYHQYSSHFFVAFLFYPRKVFIPEMFFTTKQMYLAKYSCIYKNVFPCSE